MIRAQLLQVTIAILIAGVSLKLTAAEPVTLKNVVAPQPNRPNEPRAQKFSLAKAGRFLDSAALNWQKKRKCFTCHTNYLYLYSRPALGSTDPAPQAVRKFAEQHVSSIWKTKGPRWDAEVVSMAAALAFNDAATTRTLHPLTRKALDRMWTLQQKNGAWKWLKCHWPPMESDDYFGAEVAAIAVGVAPDGYARTEAARKGLDRLRTFFRKNPPPTMHHRAMLLWAASYLDGLLTPRQKRAIIADLLTLQKKDGGWGLATLGNWKRGDGTQPDKTLSDGYGTGFVIFVLRRGGVPASDIHLKRGITWLKQNQRESGRWFTRSIRKDSHHFISHAGTAFAVMAITACEKPVATDRK